VLVCSEIGFTLLDEVVAVGCVLLMMSRMLNVIDECRGTHWAFLVVDS